MNKTKIAKGQKVKIVGQFTGRVWRMNKHGWYLAFEECSSLSNVFIVDHVCGPYVRMRSLVTVVIDLRKVELEPFQ